MNQIHAKNYNSPLNISITHTISQTILQLFLPARPFVFNWGRICPVGDSSFWKQEANVNEALDSETVLTKRHYLAANFTSYGNWSVSWHKVSVENAPSWGVFGLSILFHLQQGSVIISIRILSWSPSGLIIIRITIRLNSIHGTIELMAQGGFHYLPAGFEFG